jgi:hypothetical protein
MSQRITVRPSGLTLTLTPSGVSAALSLRSTGGATLTLADRITPTQVGFPVLSDLVLKFNNALL